MSIFPGGDISGEVNLVWLGQLNYRNIYGTHNAATYLLGTYFIVQREHIVSYRYYKKIDYILGLIGGAMLLFYLILWVPCNFINKTIHQIHNTEALLLLHNGREDDPVLEDDLHRASVSYTYFLSNPLTNFFC